MRIFIVICRVYLEKHHLRLFFFFPSPAGNRQMGNVLAVHAVSPTPLWRVAEGTMNT